MVSKRKAAGVVLATMLVGAVQVVAADPPQQGKQAGVEYPTQCTDLSGEPVTCPDNVGQQSAGKRQSSAGDWSLEKAIPKDLVLDQKNFWTSPLRFRARDLMWAVPFAGATAGLLATDTDIERNLPTSASTIKRAQDFSKYGIVAFSGVVGGSYLWGRFTHNDHLRRTGLLSGEAAAGTLVATLPIKLVTGRDRPLEGDGTGKFWHGHLSFPSEHSAAAWSIASVFAHEYPSLPMQALAYTAATAMTASRVIGRKHWSSDAFVGSALGWYLGRQVYKRHEESEFADAAYGTFKLAPESEGPRTAANMGSPYVPLDSWVYPAIDRLAALGYVQTAFMGLRPWTRMECARLVEEAQEHGTDNETFAEYIDALAQEFSPELNGVSRRLAVESIYARVTGISGQPLTDGYHFGQTIINDYGRPYQEGFNNVTGASGYASAGPLAVYVRAEYQYTPGAPALPDAARDLISRVDFVPVPPATPISKVSRFRLLDAYIGLNLQGWQIAAGKQSLWWGPGQGGPMLFSDNVEPITMVRINRTMPLKLPSILGWLGPVRTEAFFGQLAGYEFVYSPLGLVGQFGRSLDPQPFIHGQKISFKPTRNLEFSVSRTTVYGGPGYPFTFHTFLRSFASTGNELAGQLNKPGDRRSAVDFTYRLPKLRDWLTFYADGFTEDEYSPFGYPDRSVWRAGLYAPKIPALNKLDFRVEGIYTDSPLGGLYDRGYFYSNATWRTGYQNRGNLIGNWIGREGQGAQAWTTYHLGPKSDIQVNFRHQKVSQHFVPDGGTLSDLGVKSEFRLRSNIALSGFLQRETWRFPVIAPGGRNNVTAAMQLTYLPHWH